jgi:GT2 family glycosyltransferase
LARYDLVGGRMKVLVRDPAEVTAVEAFERVFAFNNEANVRRKGFSVSANLFCSREVFSAIGGFRTGVSEDVDWCRRAVAAGYRIGYAPLAVVGHPARRTWREITRKWRRLNAETFGLFRDRPVGRLSWLLRNLLLPASAVVHTPKALLSGSLANWPQRAGAIAILYRLRIWRLFDAITLLWRRDDQRG